MFIKQNRTVYNRKDILLQTVTFYHSVVHFTTGIGNPNNYPTSNCSILLQNIVVYHKKIV